MVLVEGLGQLGCGTQLMPGCRESVGAQRFVWVNKPCMFMEY